MQKKNGDQQEGITQEKLLALLEQSGRPNFTKRKLTQLTSEGLLPKLKRTSLPSSKRPVYMWEQKVVEQAIFLYDLIERGIPRRRLLLALWLHGYNVPFEPLLQCWLQPIDTLLQNLMHGEQDPYEAVDDINSLLVRYSEPKWKFSPQPDQFIRDVGIEAWIELMTVFFGMLAVPDYKPDEVTYEGVLRILQSINRIAQIDVDPQEMFSWLLFLQDVFLLPRYKDMLINAPTEEWMQARHGYLTFCRLLHELAALFPRRNARLTSEMRETLFLHWGSILPPLILAVRRSGYGDWIEQGFAFLDEFLNIFDDPDFRVLQGRL